MSKPASICIPHFADSGTLITGGTSGVGLATAIRFAQVGVRDIGIVGRNVERGETARQAILASAPGANVHFIQVRRQRDAPDDTRR